MPFVRMLSFVLNIYMMVIIFRIILTWFPGNQNSRVFEVLSRITDPYLNWFRQFSFLRIGFLDLSPIAALSVLSLVNRVFSTLSFYGTISIGIILAIMLQAVWGVFSFILGFLIIVLIIRLIAYFLGYGTDGPLMRIVHAISQPVLFRISRIVFKHRIVNFITGIIVSIIGLGLLYFVLRTIVRFLAEMLAGLPL